MPDFITPARLRTLALMILSQRSEGCFMAFQSAMGALRGCSSSKEQDRGGGGISQGGGTVEAWEGLGEVQT